MWDEAVVPGGGRSILNASWRIIGLLCSALLAGCVGSAPSPLGSPPAETPPALDHSGTETFWINGTLGSTVWACPPCQGVGGPLSIRADKVLENQTLTRLSALVEWVPNGYPIGDLELDVWYCVSTHEENNNTVTFCADIISTQGPGPLETDLPNVSMPMGPDNWLDFRVRYYGLRHETAPVWIVASQDQAYSLRIEYDWRAPTPTDEIVIPEDAVS